MITPAALSLFHSFPTDVLPIILKNLGLDLDKVALVCKAWQAIVDSPALRDEIRPLRALGVKNLKLYLSEYPDTFL